MRRRARTVLCGGRSAMVVPTATGMCGFPDEDYWPTTPSAQEFQPNVRVARDTSGATKNRTHGPPPNALSGKSIGPQEGIC
jgi:hypothetical protein